MGHPHKRTICEFFDWRASPRGSNRLRLRDHSILFAIVRLAGLYEMIAPKSSERAVRLITSGLYQDLNDHISGCIRAESPTCVTSLLSHITLLSSQVGNDGPTDAYDFACRWTANIAWAD